MGSLALGQNHAFTERVWSKFIEQEVERQTVGMSFLGKGENATFMLVEDLSKSSGERVTMKFSPTAEVDGIAEGEGVFNNAQKIDTHTDDLYINWLGFSFGLDSPMDQQRTASELKQVLFHKAKAQWIRRFERTIMNHVCGATHNNAQTNNPGGPTRNNMYTGWNAVTAYDANHIFRAGGSADDTTVGADSSLTANLDMILELEEAAMSSSYLSYPIAPGQDGFYDLVIHPMQWRQLRENSTAGEWEDIQLARLKGGEKYQNNGLANGWMGQYSRTHIHVSDYITQGETSGTADANTRRMAFLGRCAGCMAFGQGYASGTHLRWSEEVHEHIKWSLLVDSIYGFKSTLFNSEYYGSMAYTTYTPN